MLSLLSKCIDRMNLYNSAAHFGEMAGEEAGAAWKDILNLLYELLGKWAWPRNQMNYPHFLSALSSVDSVDMQYSSSLSVFHLLYTSKPLSCFLCASSGISSWP